MEAAAANRLWPFAPGRASVRNAVPRGAGMRYAMSVGDVCDRAFQLAMPEDTVQECVDAIDDVRTAEQGATRNAFYAVVQALGIIVHCTQERVVGLGSN